MLVDKTPFQAKSPQDQHLAKEILTDAQKMGQLFERLLGQLSSDERPEAQTLMQQALEKMDILNNSLALHREVWLSFCIPPLISYSLLLVTTCQFHHKILSRIVKNYSVQNGNFPLSFWPGPSFSSNFMLL